AGARPASGPDVSDGGYRGWPRGRAGSSFAGSHRGDHVFGSKRDSPPPTRQPTPRGPNATQSAPPSATRGPPIVPPALAAPARPAAPAPAGAATQAAAPVAASEPEVRCKVDACTASYRSFTRSDCTYQPSNGPRRLCTK